MTKKTNIPKKFQSKKFSFIHALSEESVQDSSFKVFPKDVKFVRKEEDEDIILIVRRHWIAYVPHVLLAFFIPIIPLVLIFVSNNLSETFGSISLYIGLFIASLVVSLNIIATAIIQWYYNVAIITDKRILSLDVVNVFQHSYMEILWNKIQDLSHDSIGPLSSILDVGNIYIDTAGEGIDLTLKLIPRPRDVQDVINNLVDLAQNGNL